MSRLGLPTTIHTPREARQPAVGHAYAAASPLQRLPRPRRGSGV